jgi:15-cis-phytoene synthase
VSLPHITRPTLSVSSSLAQLLPADEQLAQLLHLSGLAANTGADDRPPPDSSLLAEGYAACDRLIRAHSRSFFFSSQFLPPAERRAVRALYAFCRLTDDTVDEAVGDPARALAVWVNATRTPSFAAHDPVLLAWNDTRRRFQLDAHLIDELLAGVAMDLTMNRYATFADLWLYCYRVASVVGLLVMGITGAAPGAVPYAIKLGVALQLTNILRDVGEDAARGRVYLPLEDLQRFGLTADDILARTFDERFVALMQFQVERAHRLYREAWPGIALLPAESRVAVAAAARVYEGILIKLAQNGYDAYSRRAYLTTGEKLVRLPRLWFDLRALR